MSWWIAVFIFSLFILAFGTIISYVYFKLGEVTTLHGFFVFVISKLTLVTLAFYFIPLWRIFVIIFINVIPFVNMEPTLITSPPPWWVYLSYVVALIVFSYFRVRAEAKQATQLIDSQTDLGHSKTSSDQDEQTSSDTSSYKMKKPEEFSPESHLFYERIKRIFRLYRGCDLLVDSEHDISKHEILYGEVEDLGEKTPIFIICDSSGSHEIEQNLSEFINWIEHFYERKQATLVKGYKKTYYLHKDTVSIFPNAKSSEMIETHAIKVFSETNLILSCFPVNTYLHDIIDDYKTKKLPFSIRTEKEKQLSLAETFVPPSFNHQELKTGDSLESYLDQWLNTDASPRQIAILGDYGTGKSSFLRHYAAKLAENYKPGKSRIPVLISLTNTSPLNDFGLKNKLSSIAHEMGKGIHYDALMYLIEKNKVVLMLDGFDEMSYVGNKKNRLEHFDSIWQLAKQGNKIIIAGRPSYFPHENELNKALQSIKEGELISDDLPHCRLIRLTELSFTKIKIYLGKYFTSEQVDKYADFIQTRKPLLDLASRPSLMHIIREMIPEIYDAYHNEQQSSQRYSAGYLMERYAHHWIERQSKKKIKGSLSNDDKQAFFEQLAEYLYLNRTNEVITSDEVEELMPKFLGHIDFSDLDEKDGILGDILSGSFLQRQATTDHFKFVHRSFFEYFVAKRIVTHVKESKDSETNKFPKIFFFKVYWREEIASFVADLLSQNEGPLPANLQSNRFYQKTKSFLTNFSEIEFKKNQQAGDKKGFFKDFYSNFTLQLKLMSLKNEFRRLSGSVIRQQDNNFVSFEKSSIIKEMIVSLLSLYFKKNKKLKSTPMTDFKIALINSINVSFFRKDSTKDFIDDALFIFLRKHIFVESGALVKHDFSHWNLWLGDNTSIDLSGANLQGANFSHANLQNINFSGADMRDVHFRNAHFGNVDFFSADLQGASFKKANLKEVNFDEANLEDVDFRETNLENVDFEGATIENVNFEDATFKNVKGLETNNLPDTL
jgi:uncharacterized protein YjbI with pentapeptide repeats